MSLSPAYLLEHYWDGTLPINVVAIAQKLGIKVTPAFGMEGNVSGCIERHADDSFEITYDATEAYVRQRFTIAHEIGHFALDHLNDQQRCFRDMPSDFMSSTPRPQESQANSFAAELLMPAEIIRFLVEQKGVGSIEALANTFNVSQTAMSYRLKNIRMLA